MTPDCQVVATPRSDPRSCMHRVTEKQQKILDQLRHHPARHRGDHAFRYQTQGCAGQTLPTCEPEEPFGDRVGARADAARSWKGWAATSPPRSFGKAAVACIDDPLVIQKILDNLNKKAKAHEGVALPESRAPSGSEPAAWFN